MVFQAPTVPSIQETQNPEVPSTDQFASQSIRLAEYHIRADADAGSATTDISTNLEIMPHDHVFIPHQNGREGLLLGTNARLEAALISPSPPPQLRPADLPKALSAKSIALDVAVPGSSTNPRDVAPPGVVEAPAVPLGTKPKDYAAFITRQFRDLVSSEDDGPALRMKISQIALLYDQVMEEHRNQVYNLRHEVTKLKKQNTSLKTERDRKAALNLTVDSFDNSLDQVSEGQIKSAVDALNNTIDEMVMNITEEVSSIPPLPPSSTSQSFKEPLLNTCVNLPVNDERRGVLVETILHQAINQRLWALFFKGKVCCTYPDSELLEKMHDEVIILKENWKMAQKWRSVTSNAMESFGSAENFVADVQETSVTLVALVVLGLERAPSALPNLQKTISDGLGRLYAEALALATSVRRDYLSARLQVVMAPNNMTTIDTRVEVQWADSSQDYKADKSIGTYSFGLVKMAEGGHRTILLRPKVVADSLVRGERKPGLDARQSPRNSRGAHWHRGSRSRLAQANASGPRNTPKDPSASVSVQNRATREGQNDGDDRERRQTHHHQSSRGTPRGGLGRGGKHPPGRS